MNSLESALRSSLLLAAALSLPGCLGGVDGNPSRESISAKRGKDGARDDFKLPKTKTGSGKLGVKSGTR